MVSILIGAAIGVVTGAVCAHLEIPLWVTLIIAPTLTAITLFSVGV